MPGSFAAPKASVPCGSTSRTIVDVIKSLERREALGFFGKLNTRSTFYLGVDDDSPNCYWIGLFVIFVRVPWVR